MEVFAGVKTHRSPVYGMKHMVVSGHSLASLAGIETFEHGGSIVDAMIATSAVLCVVLPHATSLGGDGFILFHEAATGKLHGLNASGPAPAGATTDFFAKGMQARGPLSATVPGLVRGWEELHRKFGRLKWAQLFEPAIELAENGHPLSRVLANALHLFRNDVLADAGCAALYFPNGEPMPAATIIRQPALARSLRLIAEGGSAAYYEGPIAQSIGDYMRANGGLMSAADFKGYQPEWVEPISTEYRGHRVHVIPPNSYGLLMLLQLNALSALAPEQLGADEATRIDYLIKAQRAAFAEGAHHIADPRVSPAPLDDLLGAETTRRMQDQVLNGAPAKRAAGRGGTSCITIADGEGNAMSVVQSVFHVFGSAFIDPGTGILLNDRMMGFSNDPAHASAVAPGKRPSHTLNPVMVYDGAKPRYLLTTPGGPAQTISLVQILNNLVDRGMELTAAIDGPRWSINTEGDVLLEDDYPDALADALRGRGHQVHRASGASYFGSAKCVEILPNGVITGAADGRREAFAVGC